jgi:tetratricopeptide (TPR) repeat protein
MNQLRSTWWLVVIVLALLGAAPPEPASSNPAALVRAGDAAFERGDFETALDRFTRAEERTTDPIMVSLKKAATLYRLGQYRDAELHYGYCRESVTGEQRARLLCDLGTCLLRRAEGADAAQLLDQAADCYRACLEMAAADDQVRARAQHNLEVVQLIRAGLPPDTGENRPNKPEEEPANTHKPEKPQDNSQTGPTEVGHGQPDPRTGHGTLQQQVGQDATVTEGPPPPGQGTTLPTIPDHGELVPMAPEDSKAYLRRRATQIRQERKLHAESRAKLPSSQVKDW